MGMVTKQPTWDIYEAALLLEAVLNVESGKEKKKKAIERVSSSLRCMAINKGLSIDSTYRNINGITFQFQSMEYSAFGRLGSTKKTGSKLFNEIVAMYRNNPKEFNVLLVNARNLEKNKMTEDKFKMWLISKGKKETTAEWIIDSFNQVSDYATKKKILSLPLLDINDVKEYNNSISTIQSNKLFRITKKELYKFLQTNAKQYAAFLSKPETEDEEPPFIASDSDRALFNKYGSLFSKIYYILQSNEKHAFLTINQLSNDTEGKIEYVSDILEKASWAERLGEGYILGHNSSLQRKVVSFSVSNAFIKPTKIETILIDEFRRGYRPESIMDRNRFMAKYRERYGHEVVEKEIETEVHNKCFRFDDRFFLPKALLKEEDATELSLYLTNYFRNNKVLFYSVLYGAFENEFKSYIYSPAMLAALLQKTLTGTTIFYYDRYCSVFSEVVPDISSEVSDYLIKADAPRSYDDIYANFPYLEKKDIYSVLHYNNPEILGNSKTEYFHVNSAHMTDGEIAEIKAITQTLLKNDDFVTCNEIAENLTQLNPALMQRLTEKFSTLGIRRIMTFYLRSYFAVNTGIVSSIEDNITVIDAFAKYAQTHKLFTVDDVQNFADYVGTVPYWDTIHNYAVRINSTDFISEESIDFDVDGIDSAIAFYCDEYISLNDIHDYSRFPSCGFVWNVFLLQQYVYRFSSQFKLLSLGFSKGTASGIITRKNGRFNDFESVVIDALEKTSIISSNDAIQYLCDKGFVSEKRYKKHADLLKIAIARRNSN